MAGLITSPGVGDADKTGLVGFITGKSVSQLVGQVTQLRNNLEYDFGDLLSGASNDGTIFNIRINALGDYSFGDNLSFDPRLPSGVVDTGDALSIPTSFPAKHLEQSDVAKLAHSLLMVAKDLVSEEEFNTNSTYSGLNALELEDALDRLNVDITRPFTINGVKMEITDDELRVISRPGLGAAAAKPRNKELDSIRRNIEDRSASLLGGKSDFEIVSGAGETIGSLVAIREDLEAKYNFVAYDFTDNSFVGSDNFRQVLPALASIPDGFFFGANMALQINDALDDTVPEGAKNEMFVTTLNYFANLVVGAMTGLPSQLRSEFETHTQDIFANLVQDEDLAQEYMDTIKPVFEETVRNVFDAISNISIGADTEELREGLGIRSNGGGTYTAAKYTPRF